MTVQQQAQQATRLRSPDQVMRLARMGSFHQCRLSFMRVLLRRFARETWRFERAVFEVDAKGVGHAVYTAHGPKRSYSLVAFAHDLPADMRSDRVIAEAWDATFTLFDGIPTEDDIERLSQNVPLQEAGRVSESELSLSRANRSVRLWEHIVGALAEGRQPDPDKIDAVGYLMRTTAVYGSGKFGAADRECIAHRSECAGPFQIEMLSVFLTRAFVRDMVEHMARAQAPETAVRLDPAIARSLGIGNSTGLGMAPFLIHHPALLNNWIAARETALARVRGVALAGDSETTLFREILSRANVLVDHWRSEHPIQVGKLSDLRADLTRLNAHVARADLHADQPWDRLCRWAEAELSVEGQELLVSLLLEPYGDLVDDLAGGMGCDEAARFAIDGGMRVESLRQKVEGEYAWALAIDWSAPGANARAWYVSEEKLEPRLGERFDEPIEPYEQPLSPARDMARLHQTLLEWPGDAPVAEFLLLHPEHRHVVRRAQLAVNTPYAEIRDNTISAEVLPIDMLRCKLSFFGATHFDPRSDRWVRISMYQGAPYPDEIGTADMEYWVYPPLDEARA